MHSMKVAYTLIGFIKAAYILFKISDDDILYTKMSRVLDSLSVDALLSTNYLDYFTWVSGEYWFCDLLRLDLSGNIYLLVASKSVADKW